MNAIFKFFVVPAFAIGIAATNADASTVDFTVDASASSIVITDGTDYCTAGDCVSTEIAFSNDFSFSLAEGESNEFDFITWTGEGSGFGTYTVEATLAFSAPSSFTVDGSGVVGLATISGNIIGGHLVWTNLPTTLVLSDGSVIGLDFQDGMGLLGGSSITTTATVMLISAVPLPAGGLLLLGALGGLGAVRRRKRAA
ncbi:VPLPA-CTERM sorting domain-containing protein [Actibacterium sp. D379-3]